MKKKKDLKINKPFLTGQFSIIAANNFFFLNCKMFVSCMVINKRENGLPFSDLEAHETRMEEPQIAKSITKN